MDVSLLSSSLCDFGVIWITDGSHCLCQIYEC